ncbi:OLC1v1025778C1 [Oldenlandia corymbosa var. corymbosa]|uniref:Gamma-glutamylcyclotransferase family protein n=1 Tax=Oldenlandia corymbosa var. corymbosa TaxID=529605 RepID=A0AAV1C8L5_OLDCO|nr:OLC1v1025778C1 [Oldenlandia corymbosa var. corymbosa]
MIKSWAALAKAAEIESSSSPNNNKKKCQFPTFKFPNSPQLIPFHANSPSPASHSLRHSPSLLPPSPMDAVKGKIVPEENTRLIFTYGTLKRGFFNHKLMEELFSTRDASFVGEYTTVESFPLVVGPFGIPFLINLKGLGHRVSGELYAVSGRGLARLDELEGITTGHYERLPVEVVDCDGVVVATEVYFAHHGFGEAMWKKSGEVALREYTKEMRARYVKRADRPKDIKFIDQVWKFISSVN